MTTPFDPKRFDEKIATCQTRLEVARADAEGALNGFFDALAGGIQSWLPDEGKRVATDQTQVTQKLGDKLPLLKSDLSTLAANMPDLVRKWLGADTLWPHRPNFSPSRDGSRAWYSMSETKDEPQGPHGLNEPLQSGVESVLAPILKKYGFNPDTYVAHHRLFGSPFRRWTVSIAKAINAYRRSSEAFAKVLTEYEGLVLEKTRAEAASLWDKA
jgi:hypothetical protein